MGYFLSSSWKHNFESYIDDVRPTATKVHFPRSSLYSTAQGACNSWSTKKTTYMGGIYVNTTAVLAAGDICTISDAGNNVVTKIPVRRGAGTYPDAAVNLNNASLTKHITRP
jgi:hypothetical protein